MCFIKTNFFFLSFFLKTISPGEDSTREDGRSEVAVETSLEQEIDMVRSLLENEPLDSQAGRDKLLHELARIRVRQEERLQSALASKKSLQQVGKLVVLLSQFQ